MLTRPHRLKATPIAKADCSASLNAALNSIRKKGGGLVEAYPATRKGFPANWFGTVSMFQILCHVAQHWG